MLIATHTTATPQHAAVYVHHEFTPDDYAAMPRRRNSGVTLGGIDFPTKDHARQFRSEIKVSRDMRHYLHRSTAIVFVLQ
jgi:hypothetical protein